MVAMGDHEDRATSEKMLPLRGRTAQDEGKGHEDSAKEAIHRTSRMAMPVGGLNEDGMQDEDDEDTDGGVALWQGGHRCNEQNKSTA
jgi:hypothetical protein